MEANSRKLIKLLEADGWFHKRTTGDHHIFWHPTKPGTVTIPHPVRDIKKGTLMSIYKQAGWR